MQNLITTFAALSDKTRFMVVEQLLKSGELSVNELQRNAPGPMQITAPAFSRHLKILREAGIIRQRIDKQRRLYAIKPQAIKTIHNWIMEHEKFWQTSIDRLEEALNNYETGEENNE